MTLSHDSLYRSLAHQRRRHLLRYLQTAEESVIKLDTLVEDIVQKESDSLTSDKESIRIDLYHVHLPLLNEKGVIDFDHRSETVRYQGHQRLEAELKQISDDKTETNPPRFP